MLHLSHRYFRFFIDSLLYLWCGLNSHISLALGSTPSLKLKGCVTSNAEISVWSFLPLRGRRLSIYVYMYTYTHAHTVII